jgi:hypothetical protein
MPRKGLQTKASDRSRALVYLLVLQICMQYVTALFPPHTRSIHLSTSFQWSSITPSENLVYHDCYPCPGNLRPNVPHADSEARKPQKVDGYYKCARLLAPLDWQNTSNPNRVAIAVIKLPARIFDQGQSASRSTGETRKIDASYGRGVFVNPGGPGESTLSFPSRI